MKIRTDEHVAPKLVTFIRESGVVSSGTALDSVYEAGYSGATDVHWARSFAKEGGAAIITGDKDFTNSPAQVHAVFETGLRVIKMPPKWCNARLPIQAAFILLWWERIEQQVESMKDRQCYQPTWNVKLDGELQQIKIDFAKAQKRLKKANRRNP